MVTWEHRDTPSLKVLVQVYAVVESAAGALTPAVAVAVAVVLGEH